MNNLAFEIEKGTNGSFALTEINLKDDQEKASQEKPKPADFETAISNTGFGKFNVLLILMAIPSGWSSIFETTTMSYVFPAAQCDLELSLESKGLLNAITYTGMICGGFIWGFLCDTLGRKKLMLIGFCLDAIFVLMSAFSQNVILLMVAKFLGGFIINGPFSALTCYLSEFHCAKHRARVQMLLGVIFSMGTVILPLLAWVILPLDLDYKASASVEFHSWNLYLFICALPATTSAIVFLFMPESPKFLMTTGNTKKALQVFKKVYSINTGKDPETYPIKELLDETKNVDNKITVNRNKVQALKEGWTQFRPLFSPPHLPKFVLVCCMQMFFMMSLNTLRLWLPQIFQAMNDYQAGHNGTTAPLCDMLEVFSPKSKEANATCVVNFNNSSVYINSTTMSLVSICGYILAGVFINMLGKKTLLNILGVSAGSMAMGIYFAQNSLTTIILSSLFIALGSVTVNVVLACVVDLFPTSLRTMTVSLTMMMGRTGAMMGNLVFPVLLQTGCAAPFFSVGSIMIGCGFLSCLLPSSEMKALQ